MTWRPDRCCCGTFHTPKRKHVRRKAADEPTARWAAMGLPAPGNALILVKYSTTRFLTNQNRTMVIRIMDGAWPLWCLVGCLLLVGSSPPLVGADETVPVVGELLEPNEYGSISPEDLCQSLCGECQCRGRLVSENQCQCSCDFAVDSAGGKTLKGRV